MEATEAANKHAIIRRWSFDVSLGSPYRTTRAFDPKQTSGGTNVSGCGATLKECHFRHGVARAAKRAFVVDTQCSRLTLLQVRALALRMVAACFC